MSVENKDLFPYSISPLLQTRAISDCFSQDHTRLYLTTTLVFEHSLERNAPVLYFEFPGFDHGHTLLVIFAVDSFHRELTGFFLLWQCRGYEYPFGTILRLLTGIQPLWIPEQHGVSPTLSNCFTPPCFFPLSKTPARTENGSSQIISFSLYR